MRAGIPLLLSAAFLFVAAISCEKEVAGGETESELEPVSEYAFIAIQEDVKSALDENLKPYWEKGDAIGVSTKNDANIKCPLVSAAEGIFDGSAVTGTAPFYAVYPYNAANTFSGNVLTAVVPQTQTVSAGEFVAPGALVAACKSSNRELAFKNCVALLRIAIPRNDIKSVTVTASGEGEYLAGKFTMDVTAPLLFPEIVSGDPSLSASVVLTSASGTDALAPGSYYIAVLPSEISGISLTFQNTSDQTVSISKTAATTLARSSGANLGTVFTYEISTPAELAQWARESAKFTTWDIVNLKNDLEMSGVTYREAVDFSGDFHGNGHTISGLKVPLFAKLFGSVDHLTLHSDILHQGKTTTTMSGNKYSVGMLAHVCTSAVRPDAAITDVRTEGSITVRGSGTLTQYYAVGGLVGSSNGVPLEGCTNHADISVESLTLTGSTSQLRAGGLTGQLQNDAVMVKDCENHGSISLGAGCSTQSQSIVGGIAGYVIADDSFIDCVNYGKISNSTASASGFFTAGIAGTIGTVSGTNANATAAWAYGTMERCSNSGVILDDSACGTAVNHSVAGIVAFANADGRSFEGCNNAAAVRLLAPVSADAAVGGLFGDLYLSSPAIIRNCENTASGTVTVNTASSNYIHCGGIAAYSHESALKILDCTNRAAVTNAGTAVSRLRIGGVLGWIKSGGSIGDLDGETTLNPCYNFGRVSSLSNQTALTAIGGILGMGTNVGMGVYGSHNRGDVSFSSTASVASIYAGGIAGYLGTTPSAVIGCTTNGTIGIDAISSTKEIAAVLGHGPTAAGGTTIKFCQLAGSVSGTVIINDNVQDYVCGNKSGKMTLVGNTLLTDDPYPPVITGTLTVGTYNILGCNARSACPNNSWDEAKATLASIIDDMSCDIMTLNEMSLTEAGYLEEHLPGREMVMIPNHNGGYSNVPVILFKPARLTLLEAGIYWLWDPEAGAILETEGVYSYIDPQSGVEYKTSQGRACIWGEFMDNESGKRFYFFSPHPQHRGLDKESSLFSTASSLNSGNIRSLLNQIPYVNTENLAYIVAGDMNTNSSYVSYPFFSDSGLTSAFEQARDSGVMDATTKKNPGTLPGTDPAEYHTTEAYRLDHIYHRGFETRSYTHIFTKYTNSVDGLSYYPSDHLPVKATLIYE